ncbi:glycosyltransferase 61 family protein [Methylobacterium nodulans]|uniref:Capsular polysaccharide biosynthesis protein-like protein n=1 Tax=Methylobacterium nodulans (strain LMG 21967 / CNCM I-2342 / ORS 2060) TaxID=460265 RepID=B8IMW1_METNO|nr:glycosyltransferase 61 family protein [Methylobacterium nodulans]ACL60304.1 capsular polysaccharide biosynthesis protein-like protein [Methylobacterium nodulans ORS 2060]
MGRRLRRCRELWGESTLVEARPALRIIEDAIYAPPDGAGRWGVFAGGQRIAGAGDGTSASLPPPEPAPEATYLFVGALAPHYGHFIVDTLARLWPLLVWEGPRPRLLAFTPVPAGGADYAAAILGQLGVRPEDVSCFYQPMRLPRLLVPDPAFKEQAFVHRVFGDLCRAVGRSFWDGERLERPVYLSKTRLSSGIARIANEEAIVEELDRRGVEIVSPETLPFADQVRLFSTHRIVMGSTGSAFHTSAFAAPGRRLIGLNWMPRLHANFALIDGVSGHAAKYYFPVGTRYAAEGDTFHFGWLVRDPKQVAAELLARAEAFDRLDALDAEAEGLLATALDRAGDLAAELRDRIARHLRTATERLRP